MIKNKKILIVEEMPEFQAAIDSMAEDRKRFVDESMENAEFIFSQMNLDNFLNDLSK